MLGFVCVCGFDYIGYRVQLALLPASSATHSPPFAIFLQQTHVSLSALVIFIIRSSLCRIPHTSERARPSRQQAVQLAPALLPLLWSRHCRSKASKYGKQDRDNNLQITSVQVLDHRRALLARTRSVAQAVASSQAFRFLSTLSALQGSQRRFSIIRHDICSLNCELDAAGMWISAMDGLTQGQEERYRRRDQEEE